MTQTQQQKKVKLLDFGQRNQTTVVRTETKVDPKERHRQYNREYYSRPEIIAKRRTPEMLAYKAAYDKARNSKPEIKKRHAELKRKRRQRLRELGTPNKSRGKLNK